MYAELTEDERFPLLTERGRLFLRSMRQHPFAPIWNWPNGEQLNAQGLERVQRFAECLSQQGAIQHKDHPDWLEAFKERCLRTVPFYRCRAREGTRFEDLPTCRRADLAPRVWQFVPDDVSLDEVIVFSSSGTTGEPTRTPHHPYSAACGIPLLEVMLRSHCGIEMQRGSGQMALTNFVAYPGAYTTAIVMAYLNEAGCIRVNLDRTAWRNESDCKRYLEAWQSPVWLGDPIAFRELERVDVAYAPQAIISSIMHLHQRYAEELKSRYGCPVLDVYAMTEAGIIAVSDGNGHRIIPHDLYVEILDGAGRRCPIGVRGEITLSGGRNPYLPLLRYRTGDYASLEVRGGVRVLCDLVGRELESYVAESGNIVHSMEIVRLMREFPVRRYSLQPTVDGYLMSYQGDLDRKLLESRLRKLLGNRFQGFLLQ